MINKCQLLDGIIEDRFAEPKDTVTFEWGFLPERGFVRS